MKHPLLQEYTTEELLYEYMDKASRKEAVVKKAEQETDRIEKEKEDKALKWAEEEERKEQEEQEKWMKEKMAAQDPGFGEDVSIDFSDV